MGMDPAMQSVEMNQMPAKRVTPVIVGPDGVVLNPIGSGQSRKTDNRPTMFDASVENDDTNASGSNLPSDVAPLG